MLAQPPYSKEPPDPQAFTTRNDRAYTRTARLYAGFIRLVPVWGRWIRQVLPYIQGARLLEVSFGTGYLLDKYPPEAEIHALEYNRKMIQVARRGPGLAANRVTFTQGDVAHLPYPGAYFDTVVCTMAFSGYPDGAAALSELHRVLRPGGRLVMVDVNFPLSNSRIGFLLARFWQSMGDVLRDMEPYFHTAGFDYSDREIGAWGSVHLYVAVRPDDTSPWQ